MDCRSSRRLIEAWFVGGLAKGEVADMRAHLGGCEGCQERYDQLEAIERSLTGDQLDEQQLSARRGDRLLDEIMQQVDDIEPATAQAQGWRWRLAPVGLLLLVAAAVFFMWPWPSRSTSVEYEGQRFTVRGFPYTEQANKRLGLRLFCISPIDVDSKKPSAYTLQEIQNLEIDAAGGSCPLSGVLYFTVSNLLDTPQQLYLFGLDERLEARWYYPKPSEGHSRSVAPETLDAALGRGIVIDINHRPGPLRVFGLFSDRPVSQEQVKSAVAALRQAGHRVEDIEELMVGGARTTVQFSLQLGGGE